MAPGLRFSRRKIFRVSSVLLIVSIATIIGTAVSAENVLCPASCSCLGSLVDCSKRGLIDVPKDMPRWVKILELQNNDLSHLRDDAFVDLVHLEKLDLGYNQLRSLNSTPFQHLPELKELKLHHNHLTEIPVLEGLSNLTILSLHHNDIQSIRSAALESLAGLRILDLNHNRIGEIRSGSFPNGTNLQHLSISSNRLAFLENGCLDNLTQLESLKINKNKLSKLPKDLFRQMKKVKLLELNRNRFSVIVGLTFKGLESLEVLKLQGNRISSLLDGAFWELSKIQQLQMDYNNITIVAKGWLYGLPSLKFLSLKHNQITEIEEYGWQFCEGLLELDLSHNHLQVLHKETFSRLPKLLYLILDHNNVSFIEDGAFRGLGNLETLNLSHNTISWTIEDMMGAFTGLDNLQKLVLSSNLIKSITRHAFKGLEHLVHLDLTDNAVTSIQDNAFAEIKTLTELRLDSSNFLCDCHLSWFPQWLNASGFQTRVTASCAHPELLRDHSLYEVELEDFACDDHPKPYITEEPQTQVVLRGDNVTLTCRAASSSNSEVEFQWKKDNVVLHHASVDNTAQAAISGDLTTYTSVLSIRNISNRDEGRYQCIISNLLGATYSQKAKITVHVFPVFTKTPVDLTIKAGSTARFECAARGQPRPQITWQKDGGDDFPAARERRMHVMPSDEVFFIVNVKAADMGTYSCTAPNTAGTVVANFTLTVLEVPSFVKPMEDKETRVGKTVVLECMAAGSPRPRLQWSKDGEPLEAAAADERHFFTAEGQLLVIVQTLPADTGAYACEMSNTLGTERGVAHLTVVAAARAGDESVTGVIIIAVVCCVVGTSLIWVVIIYKTRNNKRHEAFARAAAASGGVVPADKLDAFRHRTCVVPCADDYGACTRLAFVDDRSEHSSSDSGNGDSAKRSSEHLPMSDLGHSLPLRSERAEETGGRRGHDSESSVDTLSSCPSTRTTSSGGHGEAPSPPPPPSRGQLDPTFRTFLPRAPTNHDRLDRGAPTPPIEELTDAKNPLLGCTTGATVVGGWRFPVSPPWRNHRRQRVGLLQAGISEGSVVAPAFATFPRSMSSLSHKRGEEAESASLQLLRPHQEVQNDSGSFSIVSEDSALPVSSRDDGSGVSRGTPSPLLGAARNHSKCSLPNLAFLERTVMYCRPDVESNGAKQAFDV